MYRSLLFGVVLAGAVAAAPAVAATVYPLSVENCGTTTTFAAAPTRVVALKSTSIEMLLALGLAGSIVGVGFEDGPIPPQWATAAAPLRVLSDRVPSSEIVLETRPDFVYSGWESSFSADGAGERATLQGLGVATYVSPAACRTPPYRPGKLSFEQLFGQIAEIGAIFDTGSRATALIAAERAKLAGIARDRRGLTALWYSSGVKVPYVGAGNGAPEMILGAIGLRNIMGGVDDTWISASWEAIVAANPDVIVLVDASWNSVAQKEKVLEQNPITRNLEAVRHKRYLTIPFPASEAGVRSVDAASDLARQLAMLRF